MSATFFVNYIKGSASYKNQIVHIEHLPPHEASYQELGKPLHPELEAALKSTGLLPLYTHQAAAVNLAGWGKNVMVVTPAASGKTLCYNLPVLDAILTDKGSRALYLFPTKALAQDQLRSLGELVSLVPPQIRYATFDGDTPHEGISDIQFFR